MSPAIADGYRETGSTGDLMESVHKKMISRVLILGWERGRNRLRKVMSHAKRISATPTRPRKATLVHHRPKQKCIARKWMTFDSSAKPESLLDSADHFCLNLPCKACHDSGTSVRVHTQPFTQNRSELFLSLLSAMRVRASRYKQWCCEKADQKFYFTDNALPNRRLEA